MKFACFDRLSVSLAAAFGVDAVTLTPEPCPPAMSGDVTVNAFKVAGPLKRNPMQVAAQIADLLRLDADVAAVDVVKAFVNVTLATPALFRDTVGSRDVLFAEALLPASSRKRYVLEFSAPNTNKPQHLGHVRNNVLGASIARILARLGHAVTPVNLVNDRGIHICKSMLAYQQSGEGVTPESSGKKGDHLVGDFYVAYNRTLKAEKLALLDADPVLAARAADLTLKKESKDKKDKNAYDAFDEELAAMTPVSRAASAMLLAWEKGDLDVRSLWTQMNSWVLAGFAQTYATLGIEFAQTYYESETYRAGKDMVRVGLDSGVFYKRDDGAVEIDLSAEKLDKKVVLRSDGTTVYITQDIATTLLKYEDHRPEAMIWVVGDEQIYHFQVLFAILRKLGFAWANDLHHLAYGMVNLPSGKMKSRDGTVVDADDLLAEMTSLARAAVLERLAVTGADAPADLDLRSQVIGLGALRFMLLKVSAKTTMKFDPEASVKFEGDTGPYVQYAYARNASMQRKALEEDPTALDGDVDWSLLVHPRERTLALRLGGYAPILQKAGTELDTSCIATYLLDVAKDYHGFHHDCPVLKAETRALKVARLNLSARAAEVLRDGLQVLCIDTLESM